LSGRFVRLVVDPHTRQVLGVEDADGQPLGAATPLDAVANVQRKRRKPQPTEVSAAGDDAAENEVDLAYRQYHGHDEERS